MKANRAYQDDAVSNVLGGVLMFAIVIMFMVTVQVEFVPKWTEEKEARHLQEVRGQIGTLKGELDRQAGNRSATPATTAIALGERDASRIFSSVAQPGTLEFRAENAGAVVSTDEFLVFNQGARKTYAAGEQWESTSTTPTVTDVFAVEHFRLRVANPFSSADQDNVLITVTDGNGAFAGDFRFIYETDGSERGLISRVRTADLTVIYNQGESAFHKVNPDFWWVDLLADEMHFSDVLAAAEPPLTFSMAQTGMNAEYTITYLETQGSGGSTVLIGNAGRLIDNYSRTLTGGTIVVDIPTTQFPQQKFIMEHGGVILEQADGIAVSMPPPFTVTKVLGTTKVTATMIGLTGNADTQTRLGAIGVELDGQNTIVTTGTAPDLTLTWTTAYPAVWAGYYTKLMEKAGYTTPAEYTVSTTATSCTLFIEGADAGATHDIALELARSTVQVNLKQ